MAEPSAAPASDIAIPEALPVLPLRDVSRSTTCFTPIGRCGSRARGRASSRSAPR
jgi:hypothetical protein